MKSKFLSLIFLGIAMMLSHVAQAQTTHIVQNINDNGAGSLRAIAATAVSGDTIRFAPSLLTSAVDSISLSTDISFGNKAIVIRGLYSPTDTLFISGANSSRIFSFSGAGKVVLDSLVLINGNGLGTSMNGYGGAVLYNEGIDTLHFFNSVIRNSSANVGGGICCQSILTPISIIMNNSIFSGNTSSSGGAVCCYSSLLVSVNINGSIFSGNSATADGGGLNCGSGSSTSIVIDYSTFSDNISLSGGGVYSQSVSASSIIVNNSTFSGTFYYYNTSGGGLASYSSNSSSSVLINRSTFSGNYSQAGGGVFSKAKQSSSVNITNSTIFGAGGSVYSFSQYSTSSIAIGSSILWTSSGNNFYNNGNGSPTPINSNGDNILSNYPSGALSTDKTNVWSSNLNLQPLAFNGGITKTMLPGIGSIAVDGGNQSDLTNAQNGPIIGIRDIGAAEYGCNTPVQKDTVVACDSFTWINGNTYHDSYGGIVFVKLSTVVGGCDSLFKLNLTINHPTNGDTSATACGNFTWYGTTYTSSDTPTRTIQNAAGCDSVITLHLTIDNLDLTTTQTADVNLMANATGATYQWIDCGNGNAPIAGATNQSYTAIANGSYAVIVSKGACSDTTACLLVTSLGLKDLSKIAGLKVYPNPAQNNFFIALDEPNNEKYTAKLYNIIGELVLSRKITEKQTEINTSNLSKGVYLLKIQSGNAKEVIRLIIR